LADDVAEGAVLWCAGDADEELAAAAFAESGAYEANYVLERGSR